jgi:hypothetical protein
VCKGEQRDRNLQGAATCCGKAKVSDHAEPEEEVKCQGQEIGAGSCMAGRVGIPFRLQQRRMNDKRECNLFVTAPALPIATATTAHSCKEKRDYAIARKSTTQIDQGTVL